MSELPQLLPKSPAHRPAMRRDDVFRVIAIDDEGSDLRRLEQLAAQVRHPSCVVESFLSMGPDMLAGLLRTPHLVLLDDDLSCGSSGEASIRELRSAGYAGPIAILSGLRRPDRNPDLVRAGAMFYVSKDDLSLATFVELIDMAMAVSKIMRARRSPDAGSGLASRRRREDDWSFEA